jgi:hypothetical protein
MNRVSKFGREKRTHRGADLGNGASASPENPECMAVASRTSAGARHVAEN